MLRHDQIVDAIWHTCVANDSAILAPKITYAWSKQPTTLYGIANYTKKRIYLSHQFFESNSHERQYECIAHLVCHMLVRFRWVRRKAYQVMPALHGLEWRHAMNMARAPWAHITCDTPPSEALIKKAFACECHKDLEFNLELASMLLNDQFLCQHCNGILQPVEPIHAEETAAVRVDSRR